MKILNLYAGVGGNRQLWGDENEVTAIENVPYIALAYNKLFPQDTVVMSDAHQYLLDHFREFDFIWSSPPCPSHSRARTALVGKSPYCYPDMRLYQEIIFLKHFYKGKWIVENVISYYDPLIPPTITLDRHYIWSNFNITPLTAARNYNVNRTSKETLAAYHGITLPEGTKDQRKLLRNAVNPRMGLHILNCGLGSL